MNILGISCFFHDAAACLLQDGRIIAAASEERFSRKKHDDTLPVQAARFCLQQGKITIDQVDYLAFYDKPFRKFDRILTTYLATFPRSRAAFVKALPLWVKQKLRMREVFGQELYYDGPVLFGEHHLSHAASAFLVSPFDEAAILTIDGVGEWDTASYGSGMGNDIRLIKEIRYPHSLGLLYNAFTYYLGFAVNSDEYKVMGLAPYGRPLFVDAIKRLITIHDDGSFELDLKYFAFQYGLRMVSAQFEVLFGGSPRVPESPLEQRHMDLAASIQAVTEEIVLKMAGHVQKETGLKNLCLAGGVALNCVANGRLLKESAFEHIFVQPAAGDAGGALGVATYVYNTVLGNRRATFPDHTSFGPSFDEETALFLANEGIRFRQYSRSELPERVAGLLADGKIVGWFQGRMEFGPRALGNRSILADPRNPEMKNILNRKVKFREDFRPFAPAVLQEKAGEYFEIDRPSPFMLFTARVRAERRQELPAVTHVDGSARVQTVSAGANPPFHALLQSFFGTTGCPVLLNTSFNVRGEPIVCTPRDALECFRKAQLDYLVLGTCVVDRSNLVAVREETVSPESMS